jgi:hypothetical protein
MERKSQSHELEVSPQGLASAAWCTETNAASGGECVKGLSPKLMPNLPPDPEKAGDSQAADRLWNASPFGASKLPSTDTLMLAQPDSVMSTKKPMT